MAAINRLYIYTSPILLPNIFVQRYLGSFLLPSAMDFLLVEKLAANL